MLKPSTHKSIAQRFLVLVDTYLSVSLIQEYIGHFKFCLGVSPEVPQSQQCRALLWDEGMQGNVANRYSSCRPHAEPGLAAVPELTNTKEGGGRLHF